MSRQKSSPVPPEVSSAFRQARKAKGISMERAATEANISTSLWTQIESGTQYKQGNKVQATTTAETLRTMADAVGLDAAEIVRQAGFEPRDTTERPIPHVSEILDISGLSENDLHNVAGYIAGLKARRRQ